MSDAQAIDVASLQNDPLACKLLAIIGRSPDGVLDSELETRVKDPRFHDVLDRLASSGLVTTESETTSTRDRLRHRVPVAALRFRLAPPGFKPDTAHAHNPVGAARSGSDLQGLWREHTRLRRLARQHNRKATLVLGEIRSLSCKLDKESRPCES